MAQNWHRIRTITVACEATGQILASDTEIGESDLQKDVMDRLCTLQAARALNPDFPSTARVTVRTKVESTSGRVLADATFGSFLPDKVAASIRDDAKKRYDDDRTFISPAVVEMRKRKRS